MSFIGQDLLLYYCCLIMLTEKLAEDILEINLSFKDEIKSLEEDLETLTRD
jgi:hypothetical protein